MFFLVGPEGYYTILHSIYFCFQIHSIMYVVCMYICKHLNKSDILPWITLAFPGDNYSLVKMSNYFSYDDWGLCALILIWYIYIYICTYPYCHTYNNITLACIYANNEDLFIRFVCLISGHRWLTHWVYAIGIRF